MVKLKVGYGSAFYSTLGMTFTWDYENSNLSTDVDAKNIWVDVPANGYM